MKAEKSVDEEQTVRPKKGRRKHFMQKTTEEEISVSKTPRSCATPYKTSQSSNHNNNNSSRSTKLSCMPLLLCGEKGEGGAEGGEARTVRDPASLEDPLSYFFFLIIANTYSLHVIAACVGVGVLACLTKERMHGFWRTCGRVERQVATVQRRS
jgi:hypothetical protein